MARSIDLAYPFAGRWLVQNSPANKVPSHGTRMFATAYAIDFVPVDDRGRTAPVTWASMFRTQVPEAFPGFGRDVLAPIAGVVVAVHDGGEDHGAVRGFPSIAYALTQARRVSSGWAALAGNHVLLETTGGEFVALCHLQRGSKSGEIRTVSVTSGRSAVAHRPTAPPPESPTTSNFAPRPAPISMLPSAKSRTSRGVTFDSSSGIRSARPCRGSRGIQTL